MLSFVVYSCFVEWANYSLLALIMPHALSSSLAYCYGVSCNVLRGGNPQWGHHKFTSLQFGVALWYRQTIYVCLVLHFCMYGNIYLAMPAGSIVVLAG